MKSNTLPKIDDQMSPETVSEKQSLFHGKLELFNLLLPLVFIFGAVISFFTGNQISLAENSPMNFIVRILEIIRNLKCPLYLLPKQLFYLYQKNI